MRVLITGSRDWTDAQAIIDVLAQLPPGSVVIHGAGRGADTLADTAARQLGLEVKVTANSTRRISISASGNDIGLAG